MSTAISIASDYIVPLVDRGRPPDDASPEAIFEWLEPLCVALPRSLEGRTALRRALSDFRVVSDADAWLRPFYEVDLLAVKPRSLPVHDRPVRVLEAADDQPPKWSVQRVVPQGDITLVAGDGAAFKSTLALGLGGAIVTGRDFAGQFGTRQAPVLYVSGEDGAGRLRNRTRAMIRGAGWSHDPFDDFYVYARCGVSLDEEEWRDRIAATVDALKLGVVIFDPLRDLTFRDLNADKDTAPLMHFFRSLCELPTEPGVIILHHAGKVREGQRKIDRVRGASALNQAARSILFCTRKNRGVEVEHLKCTDAAPVPPFLVETKITERDGYPGLWSTCTFTYHDIREGERLEAERPVLDFIRSNPRAKSSAVRDGVSAKYPTLSKVAISSALKSLEASKQIQFKSAAHGAKLWTVGGSTGWEVAR